MDAAPFVRQVDVRLERLPDGSGVLYDPRTHEAVALNAAAVAVWTACDGTRVPAIVAAELAAIYDAPLDIVRRDVDALLVDLNGRGLLVKVAVSVE